MSRTRWLDISLFTLGREAAAGSLSGYHQELGRQGEPVIMSPEPRRLWSNLCLPAPGHLWPRLPSLPQPPLLLATHLRWANLVSQFVCLWQEGFIGMTVFTTICLNFNSLRSWYTETSKINEEWPYSYVQISAAIKILQIINCRIFNFTQL